MKTIWYHIGAPKTGTTSIQDYCRRNREALAAGGVWYPLLDRVDTNTGRSRQPSAHHMLAHELRGSSPQRRRKVSDTGKQFEGLLEEFESGPHPAMLLSAETFFQHSRMFSPANLPGKLSSFETVVICYVRRSDEFVESLYKTVVGGQGRGAMTLEWFAQRAAPDYPRRLEGFLQLVPAKNVIIRSFDANRDRLLEDFLSLLPTGLSDDLRERIPSYQKNTALGAKHILFLRRLNATQVSLEDFLAVRHAFRHAARSSDRLTLMTRELGDRLLVEYNENVQALNARYGCALPAVPPSETRTEVVEDLSSAQIRELMAELREHLRDQVWSRLATALEVSAEEPGFRSRRLPRRERRLAGS